MAAEGRNPDQVFLLPGFRPIVGRTVEEAERKYEELAALVPIDNAIAALARPFNDHDFSQYPLDAPFPELGDLGRNSQQAASDKIKQHAKTNHLTLREVAQWYARPKRTFVGTPEQVVDEIQRWFEGGAADGFNFFEALPNTSLKDFVELAVPLLQQRGLLRTEYSASTFRGNLGLPFPINRYTRQRLSTEAATALTSTVASAASVAATA